MTILGDLFGSINPFSSSDDRSEHRQHLEQRATNLLHSAETAIAQTGASLLEAGGRLTGLDLSRNMLDYYQTGHGQTLTIPEDKLEKFKTIQQAEDKNQQRLLESITKNGVLYKKDKNGKMQPLSFNQIKNHDRVYLKDYYDVDENEKIELNNHDTDLEYSLGSFKLRTKSNLEFIRSGNKLLPYGNVEHTINDTYDFNKGSAFRIMADPLERDQKANPYPLKSQWKKMPVGVINIDDNKIDTSGIEWHPIR